MRRLENQAGKKVPFIADYECQVELDIFLTRNFTLQFFPMHEKIEAQNVLIAISDDEDDGL